MVKRVLDGLLLYPAPKSGDEAGVTLGGFRVAIVRLSLDQPWSDLTCALDRLLFADRAS